MIEFRSDFNEKSHFNRRESPSVESRFFIKNWENIVFDFSNHFFSMKNKSWEFFWITRSMQNLMLFRLVTFSELFEHSPKSYVRFRFYFRICPPRSVEFRANLPPLCPFSGPYQGGVNLPGFGPISWWRQVTSRRRRKFWGFEHENIDFAREIVSEECKNVNFPACGAKTHKRVYRAIKNKTPFNKTLPAAGVKNRVFAP